MKVLVTGSDGYIGSRLVPTLLAQNYEVVGLDTGYYRDGWLYSAPAATPRFAAQINKDLRNVTKDDLRGFDAVVHLAELSNDPLGQNKPEVTFKINHQGSVHLAELARQAGVRRFVYASSCSVYGVGAQEIVSEESPTNPQTTYAECKVRVERDVGRMGDDRFCVVFLRNATAYGASPRMRFDIVLNDLCGLAWTTKRIAMTSDGSPWRPVVHIGDICHAVGCALAAPAATVNRQIFNVGKDEENYRVRQIAEIVAEVFPGCELSFGASGADNRSYRVSFAKIANMLPGFHCSWNVRKGAQELRDLFERIEMSPETFQFRAFTRLKQLKYLTRTHQIDDNFFWKY